MKSKWKYYLFILIFLLKAGLHAEDFFAVKDGIINDAWFRFFSFYIDPKITLENAGHSSNIYYYDREAEPDWTADIGLNIQVSSILKNRFIFQLIESPSWSLYLENKQNQAFNNILSVNVYTYLSRINVKYTYENPHVYSRPTAEFGRKIRNQYLSHQLFFDYGQQDFFYIGIVAKQQQIQYDDEKYLGNINIENTLNRKEISLGVHLTKTIFTRTRLRLSYEFYEHRFQYSNNRNGRGGKIALQVQFPQESAITGNLELGGKSFLPSNPGYADFYKLFGSGQLAIRFFSRIKIYCAYTLDNEYSYLADDTYFDEKSIRSGIDLYLSRRLKIGFSYQYGLLSYRFFSTNEEMRRDIINNGALSLGIRIFRTSTLGLEYRRYKVHSQNENADRSFNFIGGFITYDF